MSIEQQKKAIKAAIEEYKACRAAGKFSAARVYFSFIQESVQELPRRERSGQLNQI